MYQLNSFKDSPYNVISTFYMYCKSRHIFHTFLPNTCTCISCQMWECALKGKLKMKTMTSISQSRVQIKLNAKELVSNPRITKNNY